MKRHAWIHPDQAKAAKTTPVPLNSDAVTTIRKQMVKIHTGFLHIEDNRLSSVIRWLGKKH